MTRLVDVVEGQGETSAGIAVSTLEPYFAPLPGCGHRKFAPLSRWATGILRHRPWAKQYPDGMIPLHAFCENYDNKRSPSSCLTMMVLGSDMMRFQIRLTCLVDL
jgi:hypothetical protein